MKKKPAIFFCVLLVSFCTIVISACPFGVRIDNAEALFAGNYGGIEWKDSYIATVPMTSYSWQVQVWDSETGKLVKRYDLVNGDKHLPVLECAVMFDKIWVTTGVYKYHLICIDIKSGDLSFIKLDIEPEYVTAIPGKDGKCASVWVSTFSQPGVGFAARQIDADGNVIKEVNVKHPDVFFDGLNGLRYVDGKFLLLGCAQNDITTSAEQDAFRIINLSATNGEYITKIPYGDVISSDFVQKEFGSDAQDFLLSFGLNKISAGSSGDFATLRFIKSPNAYTVVLNVESWTPLKVSYTGIKSSNQILNRTFFANVFYDGNAYFVQGRGDGGNFYGYKITDTYIEETFMPDASIMFVNAGTKIWVSKNSSLEQPQIYMIDTETSKTWLCNADGSRTEIAKKILPTSQ